MQTVLKNKDVDLSWYTPKEGNGVLHTDDPNALIVGFIVNDVREEWFFGLSRSLVLVVAIGMQYPKYRLDRQKSNVESVGQLGRSTTVSLK
mmetsp:Transcript_3855/g.5880  ORF Transcript_3855/g.5880 Transcript_3855/m.5880 type:complete len:91 (+) Transcript_3855:1665-1937(+)